MLATLRDSFHVERSLVAPVSGAITAVPVVAMFALGEAMGSTRGAIAMAIGANLVAILSLFSGHRIPISLAALDAVGLAVAAAAGSATGRYPWLHVSLLIVVCFGAGMLVALGPSQGTVGTQAIIAFLIIGRFYGTPREAIELGAFVLAGASVQVLALLVLKLPPSLRYQRHQLAGCFELLADVAQRDPALHHIDATTLMDGAERALSAPSLFGRVDVRDLRATLDQAKRIRLELTTIAGLRTRLAGAGAARVHRALDATLADAASALLAIADKLRHPLGESHWHPATSSCIARARAALDEFTRVPTSDGVLARQCATDLIALGGQVRAAGGLVDEVCEMGSWRAWHPSLRSGAGRRSSSRGVLRTLRENVAPSSFALRHAIRLAVAVPVAAILATWLGLPRGYWVPYAVAVILKPDYSTLVSRGVGRTLGTLLGAVLAATTVSALHPSVTVTAVLIALTAWAGYALWASSFAIGAGLNTAFLLILLSTALSDTVGTAADRFIDIVLGGLIALLAYVVWPTSDREKVGDAMSRLFTRLRDYLAVVLHLVASEAPSPADVLAASKAARLAWSNAEGAIGRSVSEPRTTTAEASRDRSLLAAALRILRATHALRVEAESGTTAASDEQVGSLAAELEAALTALAAAEAGQTASVDPELRASYNEAADRLSAAGAPETIGLHLDELVNAIDTAAFVAGAQTRSAED